MKTQSGYEDCADSRCLTEQICRAAKVEDGMIVCTALSNPYFDDCVCKFYKTKKQYAQEYRETNRFKIDPYLNK